MLNTSIFGVGENRPPKGRRFPELACIPFEQNRGVAECSTGDENIDLSS
jgi:hypothetical protein